LIKRLATFIILIAIAGLNTSWQPVLLPEPVEGSGYDNGLLATLDDRPNAALVALRLYREGEYTEAAKIYTQLEDKKKTLDRFNELYYAGGRTFLAAKDFDSARKWFENCARRVPLLADYCLDDLSAVHYLSGEPDIAFHISKLLVEQSVDSPVRRKAEDRAAFYGLVTSRFEDSLEMIEELLEDRLPAEKRAQYEYYRARALQGLRVFDAAATDFRKIWISYPHFEISEQARRAYQKLGEQGRIEALPLTLQEEFDRGLSFYNAFKTGEALEVWQELYDREDIPEDQRWFVKNRVFYWIGRAHYSMRNNHEAIKIFSRMSRRHRRGDFGLLARKSLANLYRRIGDNRRQTDILLQLAEDYKARNQLRNSRKQLYNAARSFEARLWVTKANEIYDRILEEDPDTGLKDSILWHRAWGNYYRKHWDEAAEYFKETAENWRNDSFDRNRSRYWYGRIKRRLGLKKTARAVFSKVYYSDPYGYYGQLAREQMQQLGSRVSSSIFADNTKKPPELMELESNSLDRGLLLKALGLNSEAGKELFRAEVFFRNDPGSLYSFISLMNELGYHNKALALAQSNYTLISKYFDKDQKLHLRRLLYPLVYPEYVLACTAGENAPPPSLVYAIMREESALRPDVISPVGAIGLMQLMPYTATEVAQQLGEQYQYEKLFEPETNIRYGCAYLGGVVERYNPKHYLAIAAYNAGPNSADSWGERYKHLDFDEFVEFVPLQETQNYLRRVTRTFFAYEDLYNFEDLRQQYNQSHPEDG
jgi:peptidoglycan lytic transglycosylase